jgi:hypothetical protein
VFSSHETNRLSANVFSAFCGTGHKPFWEHGCCANPANPPGLDGAELKGGKPNTGAILGGVGGAFALLLLAGVVLFAILFTRRASDSTAGQAKAPPLTADVRI